MLDGRKRSYCTRTTVRNVWRITFTFSKLKRSTVHDDRINIYIWCSYSKKENYYITDYQILAWTYRKTPLLVPGVDQFSYSNSFVLDQLVALTRTYLETSTKSHIKSGLTLDYWTLEYKDICIWKWAYPRYKKHDENGRWKKFKFL